MTAGPSHLLAGGNKKHVARATGAVWNRRRIVFDIIEKDPRVSAQGLVARAQSFGVNMGLTTAYRLLRQYGKVDGDCLAAIKSHLPLVTEILSSQPQGQHLTANDVAEMAWKRGVKLHISTVYRLLNCLVEAGAAQFINSNARKRYYEWKHDGSIHGHLNCISCNKTIEFGLDSLQNFAQKMASSNGFEYVGLEFTLHARCQECVKLNRINA